MFLQKLQRDYVVFSHYDSTKLVRLWKQPLTMKQSSNNFFIYHWRLQTFWWHKISYSGFQTMKFQWFCFATFADKLFKAWCSRVLWILTAYWKPDEVLRTESTSSVRFHIHQRLNEISHPQFPSKPVYEHKCVSNILSRKKKTSFWLT